MGLNRMINDDESLYYELKKIKDKLKDVDVLKDNLDPNFTQKYNFVDNLEKINIKNPNEIIDQLIKIEILTNQLSEVENLKFLNSYDEEAFKRIVDYFSSEAKELRTVYFAKRSIYMNIDSATVESEYPGFKIITWFLQAGLIRLESDEEFNIEFKLALISFPISQIYLSKKILFYHFNLIFDIPFMTKRNDPGRGDITIRDINDGVYSNDKNSQKLMFYNVGNVLKAMGVFHIRNEIFLPIYDVDLNVVKYDTSKNESEIFYHFYSDIFNNHSIKKFLSHLEYEEEKFNVEVVGFKNGLYNPITGEKYENLYITKNYPEFEYKENIELNDKQKWIINNLDEQSIMHLASFYYNVLIYRRDPKVCYVIQGVNANLGKSSLGTECFEGIINRCVIKDHFAKSRYTELLDNVTICFDNINNFKSSIMEFIIASTSGVSDIKRIAYKLPESISAVDLFVPIITTNKELAIVEPGHQNILGGSILDADLKRFIFINFLKDVPLTAEEKLRVEKYGSSISKSEWFYLMLFLIENYSVGAVKHIDLMKEEQISNNSLDINYTLKKILSLIKNYQGDMLNIKRRASMGVGITLEAIIAVFHLIGYIIKKSEIKKILDANGFEILGGKNNSRQRDLLKRSKKSYMVDVIYDGDGFPHFFVNHRQCWGYEGVEFNFNLQVLGGMFNLDDEVFSEILDCNEIVFDDVFSEELARRFNNISQEGNNIVIKNDGIHENFELENIKIYAINGAQKIADKTKEKIKLIEGEKNNE